MAEDSIAFNWAQVPSSWPVMYCDGKPFVMQNKPDSSALVPRTDLEVRARWLQDLANAADRVSPGEARSVLQAISMEAAGLAQAHAPTVRPALETAVGAKLNIRREAFKGKPKEVLQGVLRQDPFSPDLISEVSLQTVLTSQPPVFKFATPQAPSSYQRAPKRKRDSEPQSSGHPSRQTSIPRGDRKGARTQKVQKPFFRGSKPAQHRRSKPSHTLPHNPRQ
ncbi:hypothetical protein E2C01_056888 [Portunus trituberculatus]|uniref:Uncharacterized protein n=1 Tax=Portunus trituberculatus TaxID=210409 RepID=A0A5B7H0T5_PORTR|nr:hypothetical protein [Portunus trituberculatus]